jgi:hypothetical protein
MVFPGLAPQPSRFISGPVAGNAYAGTVTEAGPEQNQTPDCWLQLTASLTSTRLTGSYVSLPTRNCPDREGSIDLTKQ